MWDLSLGGSEQGRDIIIPMALAIGLGHSVPMLGREVKEQETGKDGQLGQEPGEAATKVKERKNFKMKSDQ